VGGIYVETRHLEKRRQTWFCVLDVPAPLRPIIGQRRLRQTLKTHDPMEARKRREPVLAEMRAKLAHAAAQLEHPNVAGTMDWLAAKAAEQEVKAQQLAMQAARERELGQWALAQIAMLDKAHPAVRQQSASVTFRTLLNNASKPNGRAGERTLGLPVWRGTRIPPSARCQWTGSPQTMFSGFWSPCGGRSRKRGSFCGRE
jgi:hypothetical protein